VGQHRHDLYDSRRVAAAVTPLGSCRCCLVWLGLLPWRRPGDLQRRWELAALDPGRRERGPVVVVCQFQPDRGQLVVE
jgi:hypothetical protein